MDKKSKTLLWILLLAVIIIVGYKYQQFYLSKNYTFITTINCDPAVETCFQVTEENRDYETAIIHYDGSPYKYAEMDGDAAPACLEETTCPDFTCDIALGDGYCAIYTCSTAESEDDVDWDTEWLPEEGWEECVPETI